MPNDDDESAIAVAAATSDASAVMHFDCGVAVLFTEPSADCAYNNIQYSKENE